MTNPAPTGPPRDPYVLYLDEGPTEAPFSCGENCSIENTTYPGQPGAPLVTTSSPGPCETACQPQSNVIPLSRAGNSGRRSLSRKNPPMSDAFGDVGPSRGGRKPALGPDLIIEVVRGLTEEDMPRLTSPDPLNSKPIPIAKLRASHHQLAQLLAQGRPDTEVSLITGYSQSRISILRSDPTFQELMNSYQNIREQVFVDTLERMKILGLSTLDELQERLESEPQRWSNRELMEMADLLLVKPKIATPMGQSSALGGIVGQQGPQQGAIGLAINVQFVKSETPPLTIEGRAERPEKKDAP